MPQPRRRRGNKWAQQAALEALVRFGPEISGLTAIQREVESQYAGDVRAARGTARGITGAIKRARPEVREIYDDAGQTVANVNAVTGGIPPGTPPAIAAAMAQEQAGFQRRMEESEASALTDLQSRKVGAQEGRAFAVQQARGQLASELGKVFQRRQDLAQESGAYQALTSRELRQAAQERADRLFIAQGGWSQSERNSLRSSGIDPNTGRPIPGGPLTDNDGSGGGSDGDENKGRGWASQEQHAAAQDQIQLALSEAKTLKRLGASRSEIAEMLKTGADERRIELKDPQTGKTIINPDGTPKTRVVPGVPKISSQLLLSAALDQAFDNHLSRRNTRLLHSRRLRISDLPVTTYQQWRRRAQGYGGRAPNQT